MPLVSKRREATQDVIAIPSDPRLTLTRATAAPNSRNAPLGRQEGAGSSLSAAKHPGYAGHAGEEGGVVMGNSSKRVTSPKVASKASKALSDGRSSARTKSIAASALSQAKGKRK